MNAGRMNIYIPKLFRDFDPLKGKDFLKRVSLPENDNRYFIFPGFCDVHVHFREPGFSYKETIRSGSMAAARGGYTDVCTMPNLSPVPDSIEHLREETDIIRDTAVIKVHPYGALTVGEKGAEISDMEGMAPDVVAFSDDGKGIQKKEMMREAMRRARLLGKVIAAHCEDESLINDGYINEGDYAREHGHPGISSMSEWIQIKRDADLALETRAKYHVCHISTKESVEIIREAKKKGADITCETAPHYILLDDSMIREEGRFKMNPPLRSKKDREAIIEGLLDGTIDMIATDHAPHSDEEKSKGLKGSAFGITGIETAFQLLYTGLVMKGIISLDRLIELMCINPRTRFGIPFSDSDFTMWDLGSETVIDSSRFISKGHSTPFEGWTVTGRCLLTVSDGKTAYSGI
ncbi:MAG: dihydroorotase [Christensenellaceae bacterium]|nr:dihydroorotase [Christensenellaceae bacterium]